MQGEIEKVTRRRIDREKEQPTMQNCQLTCHKCCLCMQEETEKVKKRRLDREKERADQEEMLNMLQHAADL